MKNEEAVVKEKVQEQLVYERDKGKCSYNFFNKLEHQKSLVGDHFNQSDPHGEHVLDGGALMHKLRWMKGSSYKDTAYVTK